MELTNKYRGLSASRMRWQRCFPDHSDFPKTVLEVLRRNRAATGIAGRIRGADPQDITAKLFRRFAAAGN